MPKQIHKTVIFITVLITFISGCRSTDEYKRLAEAGTKYADAVDSLLDTAGDIRINATSEQLLKDDRIQNRSVDDYIKFSQLDVERLQILSDLRTHNQLLKRYFERLQELATSKAPEQAQSEIGGIIDNLNTVGNKLRGSSLVSNNELFTGVTGFIISSQIRGALREELEKRNKTIDLELITQRELLDALGKSIKQDVELIQIAQEQRLVINPLVQTAPVSNGDTWITTRRTVLTMQKNVSQLASASMAINNFRDVFKAFVEGRTESDRINTLLTDIEAFVAIVTTLK